MKLDVSVVGPGARTHYVDHIAPVLHALPADARGEFYAGLVEAEYASSRYGLSTTVCRDTTDLITRLANGDRSNPVLVAGHADPVYTDFADRVNVLMMHGTGFNFDGGKTLPNYPGTREHRRNTKLILVTNGHIAEIERAGNPQIQVVTIGCPKLDAWHARPIKRRDDPPTVCFGWHWRCQVAPEAGTAWDEFRDSVAAVAASGKYRVRGHGHPRIMDELEPEYEAMGIEVVRSFDEIMASADLYVCDASSTLYEVASTGRPVVVCNSRAYRRDIDFGLRFWRHADVGVNCDDPADLEAAIEAGLLDDPDQQQKRREATEYAYAYTDGRCAERAARAIMPLLTKRKVRISRRSQ